MSSNKTKKDPNRTLAENRKARHDYHIHETYETGMVLTGTEIKSLRGGRANLSDSYAHVKNGELWIVGFHISPFEQGNIHNQDPLRSRKLLMHKDEILKLYGQSREKGYTLVPLKIYLKRGMAKLLIGLASGKKNYDKRQDLAEKDAKREMERVFKDKGRE